MENMNREELVFELEKHHESVSQTASIAQLRAQLKGALEKVIGYSPASQDGQSDQRTLNKADQVVLKTSTTDRAGKSGGEEPKKSEVSNHDLQLKVQVLQMELELMRMKMEMDNKPMQPSTRDIKEMASMVPEFCGDGRQCVDHWLDIVEKTVASQGGGSVEKFRVGRRRLVGTAELFVLNNVARCGEWEEFKSMLSQRFKEDAFVVYERLKSRHKKAGESVTAYITELEAIAAGKVPAEHLISAFVVGLGDTQGTATCFLSCRSLEEVLKLIPGYELTVAAMPTRRNGLKEMAPRMTRCFNCDEVGHISRNCTKPRMRREFSCFNCKSPDHHARACPQKVVGAVQTAGIEPFEHVSLIFHMSDGSIRTKTNALFDSGSPITLVWENRLPSDHLLARKRMVPIGYGGVGGSAIVAAGIVKLNMLRNNRVFEIKAYVVPNKSTPAELLLGRDSLAIMGIGLAEIIDPDTQVEKQVVDKESGDDNWAELPYYSADVECDLLCSEQSRTVSSVVDEVVVGDQLNQEDEICVKRIVRKTYLESQQVPEPLKYSMKIRLTNENPFQHRPQRLSFHEKEKLREMIKDLLEKGIIKQSDSPFASRIVLVRKKSGELRLCVDYRALNKLTIKDSFPLPLIEDCLDYLGNKKIFTTLDLESGYYHVNVESESQKYTAFVTPEGLYEFTKMPFGLKNAPSVFQRYVTAVFKDLLDKGLIIVYFDDILIASYTLREHLDTLRLVLERMAQRGLKLNMKKCRFACESIDYLGFVASAKGISPGRIKVKDIENFPVPNNAKQVLSFVQLCGYFRRFVKNFSLIARPLYNLTKEGVEFEFNEKCMEAFNILKKCLITEPVLSIYDPKRETELHTDASQLGFGAILMQRQDDNKMHPIAYFSTRTTAAEAKNHSFVLETQAIYKALERFRVYLEGIEFVIVTDCMSLEKAFAKKDMNRSIDKWLCEMMRYNFTVKHRSGTNMPHVDALSRVPLIAAIDPTDIDIQIRAKQSVDKKILDIREKLEQSDLAGFELVNGVVYKKGRKGELCMMVPEDMENEIIRTMHEKRGHFGINKTYDDLKEYYWFDNMREKVVNYIKGCIKCIIYSSSTKKSETALHSIPKVPVPFHTIHIDHMGPLPSILSKRKHVLVIVDAFTKFVKIYPVNSTSTKEVICAMTKYFEYYSRPVRIVSDRGSCFTSAEFRSFVDGLNIAHVKTATCAPQANGQVERVNRIIKNMLGKITDPINNGDWSRKIKDVEMAINNTKQSSTGLSPCEVLWGVKQRGNVVDYILEHIENLNKMESPDLAAIRNEAHVNIKKSQDKAGKWFINNSKGAKQYNVGDLVFIHNVDTTVGSNKKLNFKFKGPYRVDKTLPNDRYVIKDVDGCQLSQIPYDGVIEARNMRLWVKKVNEVID